MSHSTRWDISSTFQQYLFLWVFVSLKKRRSLLWIFSHISHLENVCSCHFQVINGLRLELFPSVIPALSQTRTQNAKPADIASSKKLCFNMIRYGLLVSKVLADTWLKNIENISNPGGMKWVTFHFFRAFDTLAKLITNATMKFILTTSIYFQRMSKGWFQMEGCHQWPMIKFLVCVVV